MSLRIPSSLVGLLLLHVGLGVYAQVSSSSWPHNYSGIPHEGYSPAWQSYFEVQHPLPNVTFPLGRNWAGNIAVDRQGHPNDTLFFWAWEHEHGSLTARKGERSEEPWGIWLNGGPGSSSMIGLLQENGPIHVASNYSLYSNKYSWNHLADYIWLDQPVGTGFSTASADGYIADEDQMGSDFWGFVSNLVQVFPSLAERPLYLTGESYAGIYIPYITKSYFSLLKPPTKLAKIAIGNGYMNSYSAVKDASAMQVIETFPQMIGYDPVVFNYFAEQSHLCGYDLNFTYPQTGGKFPTMYGSPDSLGIDAARRSLDHSALVTRGGALRDDGAIRLAERSLSDAERLARRTLGQRSIAGRPNGTIDPFYECSVWDEMWDYAVNFTAPWNLGVFETGSMDVYDVPDGLLPEVSPDLGVFLNDPRTVAALHAPTSQKWMSSVDQVFSNGGYSSNDDPSVVSMTFFDELAINMSAHAIPIVIYVGNDDSLVPHRSSEIVIQNTTFGGIQGFTRKPETVWSTDDGTFAGIIHQERNWTYAVVYGAGHEVPLYQPEAAYVLLREFILGTNKTGLVARSTASTSAVGPTATLEGMNGDVLRAAPQIYGGAGATQTTILPASATVAAWNRFIATRWSTASRSAGGHTATLAPGVHV